MLATQFQRRVSLPFIRVVKSALAGVNLDFPYHRGPVWTGIGMVLTRPLFFPWQRAFSVVPRLLLLLCRQSKVTPLYSIDQLNNPRNFSTSIRHTRIKRQDRPTPPHWKNWPIAARTQTYRAQKDQPGAARRIDTT